ncbi:helix-turn-helix transcriptional regulator [Streptomyces sp. NPDC001851]|uniref:helix-turn-helix transcriptional regulator n=1 Tax=Streptomyces sp. NPDC001851 TaxID=3154529 RepID=UPI00332EFDFD
MTEQLETVRRSVPGAAGEASTVNELGHEVSRQIGRLVPHDGYMLSGHDPSSSMGCFLAREHAYDRQWLPRLLDDEFHGRDLHPFSQLASGPSQVGVLGDGTPQEQRSARLHDIMTTQGFGSELRVAVVLDGTMWGTMILLRERGRAPFSPADAVHAQLLVAPLVDAVKRFVRRLPMHPLRGAPAPGLVIFGANNDIKAATATGRDWLRACTPNLHITEAELSVVVWGTTYSARLGMDPAQTLIPTPAGWIAVHGQLLAGGASGEVAITVQPAPADLLLPAVATWYGITRRERGVLELALEGLPAKQIARRLHLSPHTVNDHFKAIYRKTGVTGREELISMLCR